MSGKKHKEERRRAAMSGNAQPRTAAQPPESRTEERDMSANERFFPEELSDRQVTALPYLATAPTKQEGARMAEIDVSTLRRWQQDPVFRNELRRIREETASLAFTELNGLALKSMNSLAELLEDPNPRIKAQAVRIALSMCARNGEVARNTRRLNQLQKALTLLKNVK